MQKKAVVIHSGGLDSSLCLALAIREFGPKQVLSLSFAYAQRHLPEIVQAAKISKAWGVDHVALSIDCLQEITSSALIGHAQPIYGKDGTSNTLVMGRNGLMAHLGGIHAQHLGAKCIYLGIIEVDAERMAYRDCTREYMDLKEKILRLDFADPHFEIRTPLVYLTKCQTLELSYELGVLEFLLKESISCYEGIPHQGCRKCPTCQIRNEAIVEFMHLHPEFTLPFQFDAG